MSEMTHRTIWTPEGEVFPEWKDHPTEDAANLHALQTSRAINDEVAVVPLTNEGELA